MNELPNYEREDRPWGNFERFTLNEPSTVKIVTVNAGESISRQTHANRDEFWRVMSGSGRLLIDGVEYLAKKGDSFICHRNKEHRIEGGLDGLALLEIAFGDFDESDIIRLEDKYGRS